MIAGIIEGQYPDFLEWAGVMTTTSAKKGFAGLDDILSDVSRDTAKNEQESQTAPTASPQLSPTSQTGHADSLPGEDEVKRTSLPQPEEAHSSNGQSTVVALLSLLLFVTLLCVGIVWGLGSRPDAHKPSAELPSPAALPPLPPTTAASSFTPAIPEADAIRNEALETMLSAVRAKDRYQVSAQAEFLEKSRPRKPKLDHNTAKQSRSENSLGLTAFKSGDYDEAAKRFFDAFKLNPADVEITTNLGLALYEIGEHEAAERAFRLALSVSPKRFSAWLGIAKTFAHTEQSATSAKAFALAFIFAKSQRVAQRAVFSIHRMDRDTAVRGAAGSALAAHYYSTVAEPLRHTLGNLANSRVPVLLPVSMSAADENGHPIALYVLNNDMYPIEAMSAGYKLRLGSEPDCRASYCVAGVIAATKASAADVEVGTPVTLYGGISGTIVRNDWKDTNHLAFSSDGVRYVVSLGRKIESATEAANSSLKLGAIPDEILGLFPKVAQEAKPPTLAYPAPASTQTSAFPAQNRRVGCNISFEVSLKTFGEGVSAELRLGQPGSSTVIDRVQSYGGILNFYNLCPGNYFLAIGNDESVSVTPVRWFERNVEYRSTIRMQSGSGNVVSRRRNAL